MTGLTQLTLSDAVDGLKAKTFSSKEITQAFLAEIDKSNRHLNAYVVVTADKALDALSKFGGTVLKTSLSDDATKQINEELHGEVASA